MFSVAGKEYEPSQSKKQQESEDGSLNKNTFPKDGSKIEMSHGGHLLMAAFVFFKFARTFVAWFFHIYRFLVPLWFNSITQTDRNFCANFDY